MTDYAYFFSQGIVSSPYLALKTTMTYIIPWFSPTIYWESPASIELSGGQVGKDLDSDTDILKPEKVCSSKPRLSIHLPTPGEIGARALTTLVIDLPLYTLHHLHAAPIPTIIALYAVLPATVWAAILPRLFRLLPTLLI